MTMFSTRPPWVWVIGAGLSSYTQAQTTIEEVQVWGTEVQASSMDLGEDAIAIRQADHISDLLRFIPGVDVGGAHSLNQRITVRSLDDKDLVVTVDGAIQNTYMFHHMGNLQIHADVLKKADIDVGSNSVLSGGLGGSAQFETRAARDLLRDDQRLGLRLHATYADNASKRASVTAYAQITERIDALAYLNRVESDNYEVGGGEIKNADGERIEGTDGRVRGLKGALTDGLVKLGLDITARQRLKIGHERYRDKGDYSARPDMGLATDLAIGARLGTDGQAQLYPTEFTRDTSTLNYDAAFDNTVLEAALFRNTSQLQRDEAYLARGALVEEEKSGDATNTGARVLIEHELGRQTLTYGAESTRYETQYQGTNRNTLTRQSSGESAHASALYLQDAIALGALTLTPGLRLNQWQIDSNLVNKRYFEPTFALALQYDFSRQNTLKASATELFKGPELSEVFTGAGATDVYNPDIKAETGRNLEFALQHHGDTVQAGMTLFDTKINDYIYDYISYTLSAAPYPKDNIGDMKLRGLEAFWGLNHGPWDLLLSCSTIDSELDANATYVAMPAANGVVQEGFDGARTDRSYGTTYGINLDYILATTQARLHYDLQHVGRVNAGKNLDGAGLNNAKEGYTVHNVSAQWQPASIRGLTLTVGIDNVLDEYYASQASRTGVSFHPVFGELYLTDYEPGRNIKTSVAYQF